MIIIIEGPDGSGKTSLANTLSKQLGYPILHRTRPETEEEKREMLEEYVRIIRGNKNMILDRCWYSEIVYGSIMRDSSYISFYDMYDLEKLVAKHGGILIYATGPSSALWNRCQRRGEDYITSRDTFNAIHTSYTKLMSMPHYIPVLKYEYKDV